ncbi:MAG TPA: type II secretion system protein GspM [Gammaproteobacteria bacterium]|nr:type II secretion system protein GspM [Gammaproteobacteria bacterium]
MKDWWLNLALREKQIIAAGSVLVILFLIYEIIWSPLANANDNLRTRIQHNYAALSFLKNTNQHIQELLKTSQEIKNQSPESFLGTLQAEINKSEFAQAVTALRQGENDSMQFILNRVNFDRLVVFLTSLWKQYHFIVADITVTPTGTPGEVTANVTVK